MKKIAYQEMFENEMTHPWYVATRELMVYSFKKYLKNLKNKSNPKILDAGCGTGGTIKFLKEYGFKNIHGVDSSEIALSYCRKRGIKSLKRASVNKLPFENETFDAVVCLDVLYHKGVRGKSALFEFKRVLKRGGLLYLQEPAYNWLKSRHDIAIETKHRFTRSEIRRLIQKAGLEVIKITYFNSILLVPIIIKRMFDRFNMKEETSDVKPTSKFTSSLFKQILFLEIKLVNYFVLPFGLSISCFAQKK